MTSTLTPSAGACADAITLRICGGERDGQVVRLSSPKCSIGSRPGCTLRLRRRGLQPVHCLIVRGPGGVFVRRWGADTLLNGRTFVDAPFMPADRLRCGPIEFELVDEPRATEQSHHAATPAPVEDDRLSAERLAYQQERERWLAERKEADQQLAALTASVEGQLNELRARQEVVRAEQQQWQSEIAAARAAADEQRLTAEREQQARWALHEQLLAERLRELESSRCAFEATNLAFEDERRQWESHRQQSEQDLGALRQALEKDRQELEAMRAAWDAERNVTEAHWAENRTEVDQQRADIEAQKLAMRAQHDARVEPRRRDPWEEPTRVHLPDHEPTPDEAPMASSALPDEPPAARESEDEVFARLRAMSLLKDEEQEDFRGEPMQSYESPAEVVDEEPVRTVGISEDGEPSIEEYMSALMHRVGGQCGGAATPAAAEVAKSAPVVAAAPAPSQPEVPEEALAEVTRKPRKHVPELKTDLAAMRELANFSLKTALTSHSTRRSAMRAVGKAFISIFAFATALVTWYFAAPDSAVARFSLPASLLLGILFAVHSVTMVLRVARGQFVARHAGVSRPATKSPEPEAAPPAAPTP
jgi:hypothetical protein